MSVTSPTAAELAWKRLGVAAGVFVALGIVAVIVLLFVLA